MAKYYYTGKTVNGIDTNGYTQADSVEALEKKLLANGVFLIQAQTVISKSYELYLKYFKYAELTKSARQLNLLLKSGISLLEALDLTSEQLKDKHLKSIWLLIKNGVEEGKSLSDLLIKYPYLFDQLYVGMVTAGEISGDLSTAFDRIATYRESMETLSRKIRSALAYPALVILVAVMVVFALIIYVVPVFSSMYANFGSELPQLTQGIVAVSGWLRGNVLFLFLGVGLLIILAGYAMFHNRVKYFWHGLIVKIPFLKDLLIKFVTARFSRTMGSLLVSGVEIIQAYTIAAATSGNVFIHKALNDKATLLSQGKSLTETITAINIFPNALLKLIASGEKTGSLGEMLIRASEYYEKETESSVQIITTLLEPLIIIVLGIVVAFILIAMYLPLFDLVGQI